MFIAGQCRQTYLDEEGADLFRLGWALTSLHSKKCSVGVSFPSGGVCKFSSCLGGGSEHSCLAHLAAIATAGKQYGVAQGQLNYVVTSLPYYNCTIIKSRHVTNNSGSNAYCSSAVCVSGHSRTSQSLTFRTAVDPVGPWWMWNCLQKKQRTRGFCSTL